MTQKAAVFGQILDEPEPLTWPGEIGPGLLLGCSMPMFFEIVLTTKLTYRSEWS
jgi:hypothetical protein